MGVKLLSTSPLQQRVERAIQCWLSWANGIGTDLDPDDVSLLRLENYDSNLQGFLREIEALEADPGASKLHGNFKTDLANIRGAIGRARAIAAGAVDPDALFDAMPADRRRDIAVGGGRAPRDGDFKKLPKEMKQRALQAEKVSRTHVLAILDEVRVE